MDPQSVESGLVVDKIVKLAETVGITNGVIVIVISASFDGLEKADCLKLATKCHKALAQIKSKGCFLAVSTAIRTYLRETRGFSTHTINDMLAPGSPKTSAGKANPKVRGTESPSSRQITLSNNFRILETSLKVSRNLLLLPYRFHVVVEFTTNLKSFLGLKPPPTVEEIFQATNKVMADRLTKSLATIDAQPFWTHRDVQWAFKTFHDSPCAVLDQETMDSLRHYRQLVPFTVPGRPGIQIFLNKNVLETFGLTGDECVRRCLVLSPDTASSSDAEPDSGDSDTETEAPAGRQRTASSPMEDIPMADDDDDGLTDPPDSPLSNTTERICDLRLCDCPLTIRDDVMAIDADKHLSASGLRRLLSGQPCEYHIKQLYSKLFDPSSLPQVQYYKMRLHTGLPPFNIELSGALRLMDLDPSQFAVSVVHDEGYLFIRGFYQWALDNPTILRIADAELAFYDNTGRIEHLQHGVLQQIIYRDPRLFVIHSILRSASPHTLCVGTGVNQITSAQQGDTSEADPGSVFVVLGGNTTVETTLAFSDGTPQKIIQRAVGDLLFIVKKATVSHKVYGDKSFVAFDSSTSLLPDHDVAESVRKSCADAHQNTSPFRPQNDGEAVPAGIAKLDTECKISLCQIGASPWEEPSNLELVSYLLSGSSGPKTERLLKSFCEDITKDYLPRWTNEMTPATVL
ncbi:hypothetical protein TWF730_003780 [Orbilia blumenaviensis]|uniref:Uncharacterized protein n=1 Tax=Orbilia blumenaviensis TaxID=1796055 RepID=A0AAV9U6M6_9PEZI